MGIFDLFDGGDKKEKRDFWGRGSVSERHFGRDRFGFFNDEEELYSDDERFHTEDRW